MQKTERLRGRRGVEQRKRRLAAEPLCRDCKAKGRITAATVPDHVVPLEKGGTDTDENIRCLCEPCHLIRTAEEFGLKQKTAFGLDGWPLADGEGGVPESFRRSKRTPPPHKQFRKPH